MKLQELAQLFNLKPDDLIVQAEKFGIDLVSDGDEVDEVIVTVLKEKLGLAGATLPEDSAGGDDEAEPVADEGESEKPVSDEAKDALADAVNDSGEGDAASSDQKSEPEDAAQAALASIMAGIPLSEEEEDEEDVGAEPETVEEAVTEEPAAVDEVSPEEAVGAEPEAIEEVVAAEEPAAVEEVLPEEAVVEEPEAVEEVGAEPEAIEEVVAAEEPAAVEEILPEEPVGAEPEAVEEAVEEVVAAEEPAAVEEVLPEDVVEEPEAVEEVGAEPAAVEEAVEEAVAEEPAAVEEVLSEDVVEEPEAVEEVGAEPAAVEEVVEEAVAEEPAAEEETPAAEGDAAVVDESAAEADLADFDVGDFDLETEEEASEDNAVAQQQKKFEQQQKEKGFKDAVANAKELKRVSLAQLDALGDKDNKQKTELLERLDEIDVQVEKAEERLQKFLNGEEVEEEVEEAVTEEKKKKDPFAFLAPVKAFFADFIFLTFKNKAHLILLVTCALISTAVAVSTFLIFGGTQEIPEELLAEKDDQPDVTIAIQGGIRDEKEMFQIVWEMYSQGYYKVSLEMAEQFIESYPMSEMLPDVYFKIGDILYHWDQDSKTHQYKRARIAYEKAIELFPDNNKVPWAMYQVGNTFFSLKLYEDAEKAYRKVIELFATYKELDRVRYKLALAYLLLEQFERSRMEFKKLIDTFPQSVLINNAYLRIAETYYRENDYPNAIRNYLNYVERYPESPKLKEVYFRIAKLSEVRKNYEAAIMYFKRSMGTFPFDKYNERALYHIAESYTLMNEYQNSRDEYQKIVDTYPDTEIAGLATHRIADTYFKEGVLDKAQVAYEFALEKYPSSKLAQGSYIELGEVYFQQTAYQKMIDTYVDFINMDPNYFGNDRLILRIGQAYFNAGDYLEAADWFLRLIKDYPMSDLVRKAYFGRAKANESAQYYEEAIKTYEEFVSQYPDHPKVDYIMYQIAMMYKYLNRMDDAVDTFNRLREKFIVSDYRYKALVEIGKAYEDVFRSEVLLQERADALGMTDNVSGVKDELGLIIEETFLTVVQNKALEGRDEHFEASLHLAQYYQTVEMFPIAFELLEKALSLYGGQVRTYQLLKVKGAIAYRLHKLDETVSTYEELISVLSTAVAEKAIDDDVRENYALTIAESYIALGDILYAEDKFAEALYIYLESLKHMPQQFKRPWPFYQVANCYNRLNNYEKANFYYEKVKEEFPDSFWNEHIGWNQERMQWEQSFQTRT